MTSIVLGFLDSGGGSYFRVTVSPPSVSAFSDSENLCMNLPTSHSILTYFAPSPPPASSPC